MIFLLNVRQLEYYVIILFPVGQMASQHYSKTPNISQGNPGRLGYLQSEERLFVELCPESGVKEYEKFSY